jgi:hypothetical protein
MADWSFGALNGCTLVSIFGSRSLRCNRLIWIRDPPRFVVQLSIASSGNYRSVLHLAYHSIFGSAILLLLFGKP